MYQVFFFPFPGKKKKCLITGWISTSLSGFSPTRPTERERGLRRAGRREPWEQGWSNLKSTWDRTVQIVKKNENRAGWRGLWWMVQFSFQPFPCMLVNQRENLLLDQDPLWASHLAPLCGWVSTPAPFSHNYDCGSVHLISLSWNS